MQAIIGMPPIIIIIGMPAVIIWDIRSQQAAIMSMVMPPSIGIILQTMPVGVISIVMEHIGIMPPIAMGIIPIAFPIIGIMFIGIMPPMDIMAWGIMAWGIMDIIGICIAGIIGKSFPSRRFK